MNTMSKTLKFKFEINELRGEAIRSVSLVKTYWLLRLSGHRAVKEPGFWINLHDVEEHVENSDLRQNGQGRSYRIHEAPALIFQGSAFSLVVPQKIKFPLVPHQPQFAPFILIPKANSQTLFDIAHRITGSEILSKETSQAIYTGDRQRLSFLRNYKILSNHQNKWRLKLCGGDERKINALKDETMFFAHISSPRGPNSDLHWDSIGTKVDYDHFRKICSLLT